jgi:serine/threonine-protein kinase
VLSLLEVVYDVPKDPASPNTPFWIVLEYAARGSVADFTCHNNYQPARGRAEVRARCTHAAKAKGLACLHARKTPLLHRDIKPENVMLMGDWTVKLVDFGTLKRSSSSAIVGRVSKSGVSDSPTAFNSRNMTMNVGTPV